MKSELERDWIKEDASPLEGMKSSFNQDWDHGDSASNGENEKDCLKFLDLSVWGPRPFGEDNNRNALLEEICRLFQAIQGLPWVFPINRDLARPPEGQAQEGNRKNLLLDDVTEIIRNIGERQKGIEKAGVVRHKDIGAPRVKTFLPLDMNPKSC